MPESAVFPGSFQKACIESGTGRHLEPLAGQELSAEDQQRLANLGKNGSRDVTGLSMTHCVPNAREELAK